MARKNSLPNMAEALQEAIDFEHLPGLARLIKSGRPWTAPGDPMPATPLSSCLQSSWMHGFDALLASGCAVDERNQNGFSPLSALLHLGDIERAAKLIAAGADLHSVNRMGGDAMHSASAHKEHSAAAVRMLLDANGGSWPRRFDSHGRCPLMLAAQSGRAEAVRLLAAAGMDPNTVGPDGFTPALCAIQAPQTDCLLALLAAGAAVDGGVQNHDRCTIPLHLAAGYGQREHVEVLLAHGADPMLRSLDGRTAAEEAMMSPSPHAQKIHDLIGRHIALMEAKEIAAQVRRPRPAKKASPRAL